MRRDGALLAVVVVATGRYLDLASAVVADVRQHVHGLGDVFVLSDASPAPTVQATWLPWGHLHWPYPSLLRYRAVLAYRDVLEQFDALLLLDVDMRIRQDFEIPPVQGTIAVEHPGYVGAPADQCPYERNPTSASYVPTGSGSRYFAGAVQGASTSAYLEACRAVAELIQTDLRAGVMPIWHDESAWNRYCVSCPPEFVFDSRFCWPDTRHSDDAVVVALTKNHSRLREERLRARVVQRWDRVKTWSVRALRKAARLAGRSA